MDKTVSLSFYKKTINKEPDTQEYNIKGIYGMNGSGKSGIVTSVEILRNLIIDTGYLNNPITQNHLDAIVNKKVGKLSLEAEFMAKSGGELLLYQYEITLSKNKTGKFTIAQECLKGKKATLKSSSLEKIYEVCDGEIIFIYGSEEENGFVAEIRNKTMNLLSTGSVSALIYDKLLCAGSDNYFLYRKDKVAQVIMNAVGMLFALGHKLHVYLDESEWSDMVAEMRVVNTGLRKEKDAYQEINRILLRENLDLRDTLKENNLLNEEQLKDLKDVYSVFAEFDEVEESPDDETKEVTENESE